MHALPATSHLFSRIWEPFMQQFSISRPYLHETDPESAESTGWYQQGGWGRHRWVREQLRLKGKPWRCFVAISITEGLTIHSPKENSRLGTKATCNISQTGQRQTQVLSTLVVAVPLWQMTQSLWCWELPTTWTFNTSICTSGWATPCLALPVPP